MENTGQFMEAAGFDEVDVGSDTIHVANQVGLVTIELSLTLIEDSEYDLAYEQRDGIFEEMRTTYTVSSIPDGSKVTATTEFAVDVAFVGDVLDSTIVKRQRRKELTSQFNWLESIVAD